MKPLKEKISITIDWDVLEAIKKLAENDDRSLSQYINIVLKNHVKKKISNFATRQMMQVIRGVLILSTIA